MRILLVAMSNSIHTARWIKQFEGQGWDVHLFPSVDVADVHPELAGVTVHHSVYGRQRNQAVRYRGVPVQSYFLGLAGRAVLGRVSGEDYRARQLAKLIERLKPDIVHSLEIQHAGYLTLEAKKLVKGQFPKWIVTNWGSDIYLFGQLAAHAKKITDVLRQCDYYSCECERDVGLAQKHGLKSPALPVFPNTGGFDLEAVRKLRSPGPVSKRRLIMLKGYQDWFGRALFALRALEQAADVLKGYEIVIYAAHTDSGVPMAAELFTIRTGIPTRIIPRGTANKEILALHGQARISIGASISDAISTSFLEALVMGSFPIQSNTACANEWVTDGVTGFIVPPEDPAAIEQAIRKAVTDDKLVEEAAKRNWTTAQERLDQKIITPKVLEFYKTVREAE